MNYKNIIFDFGNVVGSFDANYILNHYVDNKKDLEFQESNPKKALWWIKTKKNKNAQ